MKKDERFWWAVLVDADMYSEMFNRKDDGQSSVYAMNVGNIARQHLVEDFGLNLDDICPPAREEYHRLFAEMKQKDEDQKAQRAEVDALVDRLKKEHGL